MAGNRHYVNIVFSAAVLVLSLTAFIFAYRNLRQPPPLTDSRASLPAEPAPNSQPDIDAPKRIEALERLSAGDPRNPEYLTQIANSYFDLGDYEKAAEVYQRSLEIQPGNANAETDLATCLHYLGRQDQALEILDKVLQNSPNFPEALFNKGIVLAWGKKDAKGGIAVWEELLRSDPAFAQKVGLEEKIRRLKASAE